MVKLQFWTSISLVQKRNENLLPNLQNGRSPPALAPTWVCPFLFSSSSLSEIGPELQASARGLPKGRVMGIHCGRRLVFFTGKCVGSRRARQEKRESPRCASLGFFLLLHNICQSCLELGGPWWVRLGLGRFARTLPCTCTCWGHFFFLV